MRKTGHAKDLIDLLFYHASQSEFHRHDADHIAWQLLEMGAPVEWVKGSGFEHMWDNKKDNINNEKDKGY